MFHIVIPFGNELAGFGEYARVHVFDNLQPVTTRVVVRSAPNVKSLCERIEDRFRSGFDCNVIEARSMNYLLDLKSVDCDGRLDEGVHVCRSGYGFLDEAGEV